MHNKFLQQFKNYIEYESLVKSNQKIIIAVSGGYDSIVLLDLLFSLESSYNLKLVIAHVNHCLRGKNADRDEEFVKNIAA